MNFQRGLCSFDGMASLPCTAGQCLAGTACHGTTGGGGRAGIVPGIVALGSRATADRLDTAARRAESTAPSAGETARIRDGRYLAGDTRKVAAAAELPAGLPVARPAAAWPELAGAMPGMLLVNPPARPAIP
jgi:hypothetical protein